MDNAISIEGVTKNFGPKRVLDNISFNVPKKTIHGYLGYNAAGKTTTIRIALGLLTKDSGKVKIFDADPLENPEIRARIGYVSKGLALYTSETVKENLIRFCKLRDVSDARKTTDKLVEESGLKNFANSQIKKLSASTKQCVMIARALIGQPELLILDEPFTNLNPIQRDNLKKKFKEMREEGNTILIATHILSDVEELCDDVTIIKEGRILFTGTISELRHRVPIESSAVKLLTDDNKKAYSILSKNYPVTESSDGALIITIKSRDDTPNIAKALCDLKIYELKSMEPGLEAIYRQLWDWEIFHSITTEKSVVEHESENTEVEK